jgi:hypothetical protein
MSISDLDFVTFTILPFKTILVSDSSGSGYLHNKESLVNRPEGLIQVSSNAATV